MIPRPVLRKPAARLIESILLLLLALAGCGRESPGITVYAAASLTEATTEAAQRFQDSTGVPVRTRFGATGMLATQIEAGAPADVFIAADLVWMRRLQAKNLLVGGTGGILTTNRLVVVVPATRDSGLAGPAGLLSLQRIALGDTAIVPAGRYATQSLKRADLWNTLAGKVVFTPDVRGALALVDRGEVDAAVVYASDARASERARVAFDLPAGSHDPVVYPAAILLRSTHGKEARAFLDFLRSPAGQDLFRRYGFGG
jgi:molybdate transport system substrate-binding protein